MNNQLQLSRQLAISFPESSFPLTSGQKTIALEAFQAYATDKENLHVLRGESEWVKFKKGVPRALDFRPLVEGNEDYKNEIAQRGDIIVSQHQIFGAPHIEKCNTIRKRMELTGFIK